MSTPTLYITVGLPRSGKSTWARKQGHPIVNRDAIRLALHGEAYIPAAEAMVTAIEEYMVKALFLAGNDTVIVDATHLAAKYINRWVDYAAAESIMVVPVIADTAPDECIRRAQVDGREDLIPVIKRMTVKYREVVPWLRETQDCKEAKPWQVNT